MKIYLAARYGLRNAMKNIALFCIEDGHSITSRWVWGNQDGHDDGVSAPVVIEGAAWAKDDFDDIAACDLVISFTDPCGAPSRGGRHVEFGIGLALGKRLWIVGRREHIFHCLPRVQQFSSVYETMQALRELAASERAEMAIIPLDA